MAIVGSSLTASSSTGNSVSYVTASYTPGTNNLILASIWSIINTGPALQPTLSGNNLSWQLVSTNTATSALQRRLSLFRSLGSSPQTGSLTISFGAETQNGCIWNISQFTGVNTGGSNGSGAIATSANTTGTGFATSLTIGLVSFSDPLNAGFGICSHNSNEGTTPGSGFTELNDVIYVDGGDQAGNQTEWAVNDNTVDWSWSTSARNFGIAVEIISAITSGPSIITGGGLSSIWLTQGWI